MLEAISHPLIDSSSKETFPGGEPFHNRLLWDSPLSPQSTWLLELLAISLELRAQLSHLSWRLTSPLRQVWPWRMWLPKRCCQTGEKAGGKVHPTAKYWSRGQGGKAWASHDSGPGQGHWKSGFHPSLDLGQVPLSPFASFHSQMSSAFIMLFIKLSGAATGSCYTLLQHVHNRILILPQVCWHGSNEKKKWEKKGVNTSKSVKIFKDRQLQGVQMNLS